jgi:RNA polymerase primary sigma factor
MESLDDLNLEGDQMDQLYDSLEVLNIDISSDEDILPELPDEEPADKELAEVEEEELVDPNALVNNFSIDDPVRMYLKEIGKVPLLSPMRRSAWPRPCPTGTKPRRSCRNPPNIKRPGNPVSLSEEEEGPA